MALRLIIREDEVLCKMASRIFGEDIIDSAYVTTWALASTKESEVSERLARNTFKKEENDININAVDFIIRFKNGKEVYFTCTEWATIGSIDMNEETQLLQ